jgi:formylmethanofuran dehydrogenase subunit E
MEKTCTKCGLNKPATKEYFHRWTDKLGAIRLRAACRECVLKEHADRFRPAKRKRELEARAAKLAHLAAQFVGPPMPAVADGEFRCSKCRQNFEDWFRSHGGRSYCRGCARVERGHIEILSGDHLRVETMKVYVRAQRHRRKASGIVDCRGCGETFAPEEAFRNPTNGHIESICIPCHRLRLRINRQQQKSLQLIDPSKVLRRSLYLGHRSPSFARLVGYSIAELRAHLERQFCDGMSWESFNRGEIHIDHISPQRTFNLLCPDEFRSCWALPNLRPVWARENLSKGGKQVYLI